MKKNTTRRSLLDALLFSVFLVGVLVPFSLVAQSEMYRIEGEYGLWVSHTGGDVTVAWLTEPARAGILEVIVEGDRVLRQETPPDDAHRVSFPRPRADRVLLRYGVAGSEVGDLHQTELDLGREDRIPEGVLSGVDSLFVVGDIHGEYARLLALLNSSGLVDGDGRWSGGRRHVVFLGDVPDRGADVTRTLWFLYRLEGEAAAAGGGAHVVLGNHEVMNFTRDLRYVSAKETLVAQMHGTSYPALFDLRESHLGRWLAGRPALMKVDEVILAHGGLSPSYASYPVQALNDSIRGFLSEDILYEWWDTTMIVVTDSAQVEPALERYRKVLVVDSAAFALREGVLFGEDGPLWFRGYVRSDGLEDALRAMLERQGSLLHVVGHTPVPTVQSRYGGRLIAVDMEEAATEMLLLVRDGSTGRYQGWSYGLEGRIAPVEVAPPG